MHKIKVCSSERQIAEALKSNRCICFCVSDNFNIYIHHDSSHISLEKYLGLMWEDIVFDGNASFVTVAGERHIVVRCKSSACKYEELDLMRAILKDYLIGCCNVN